MDPQPDTVRSRICKDYSTAIARHYSRDDVPHEAARAAANHRHDAALARVRAATRVLISDTVVDANAYPGVATVVYAGCVPHLPLALPPKPDENRAAPAPRFFSFAHGEPTAWTWAANVAERPATHAGPDLAPVQLLNRLLRGFLRDAKASREAGMAKKANTEYIFGWIHVIVEGTMRNDVMMMLLLLSADEPRARVALSDDECLFIPHLVGNAKACTSIVYRSMYIDGCADIRYLDPVRIELKSDSSGFGDIESADVEKSDSIDALAGLIKTTAANTRGNFSAHNPASEATVGVAQHPGATYSPADVFLCDAAAIRPLRISDTQTKSVHAVSTVKPGEIYAGLFDTTDVLRRFYAMAYYASYLSGSARESLHTLAAVLETNGVRIEPAVVPPLPHFAPAARSFEPIVDAYGSDGKEKIRNGAVAVRMTDLPPPISFSADGVVRYCYPVCRLGRYTDSSDFAYAALRRGELPSHANRKTADNKADADDTGTEDAQTATDGDDDDDDDDDDEDFFDTTTYTDALTYIVRVNENASELEKKIDGIVSHATDVKYFIATLGRKARTAGDESNAASKQAKDAQNKADATSVAAFAAIAAAAVVEAKVKEISGADVGSHELPEDTESPEHIKNTEDVNSKAYAAASTAYAEAKATSENAQKIATDAASDANVQRELFDDIETTRKTIESTLDVFRRFLNDGTTLRNEIRQLIDASNKTVSEMQTIIRDIENGNKSVEDTTDTMNSIKAHMESILSSSSEMHVKSTDYDRAMHDKYDHIDRKTLNLVRGDVVRFTPTMDAKIQKSVATALSNLRTRFEASRDDVIQKKAEDAALAAAKRQAAAPLPSVQYSDRFFAWGHRYACVVLSALPGAPPPLPRIAAHYLYLRTVCAARELVTPDEVRQLHAAFGKATHHPEHAMREFDRLTASHTAIQVGYEGILAPLLIRTVVDPRVSRCVRVRAGAKYGSDYAPYIGLFEFGPTTEPPTSDWPGRKVRIRLSREPAAGTRLDEMVSLLLLDANPDVKWTEPDTVFAAIRAHHTLLRDADWFLPIADGMRAGLSKTVVGTWRLRLHFAIQADAEAYATGLVGRLKTRSDYIAAGAESVTLLLGGQAVGVAITMEPVVRGTRAE